MEKRIFIHAVYATGDRFDCRHPGCGFSGDLSEAVWHVVKNQFKVEAPKKS